MSWSVLQRARKTQGPSLVSPTGISRYLQLTFVLNSYKKLASFLQFMVLFVGLEGSCSWYLAKRGLCT